MEAGYALCFALSGGYNPYNRNLEEDDAVFVTLLKHNGYEESEVSTSPNERFTRRTFGIRAAAKRALLERGKSVPVELVVEKDPPL